MEVGGTVGRGKRSIQGILRHATSSDRGAPDWAMPPQSAHRWPAELRSICSSTPRLHPLRRDSTVWLRPRPRPPPLWWCFGGGQPGLPRARAAGAATEHGLVYLLLSAQSARVHAPPTAYRLPSRPPPPIRHPRSTHETHPPTIHLPRKHDIAAELHNRCGSPSSPELRRASCKTIVQPQPRKREEEQTKPRLERGTTARMDSNRAGSRPNVSKKCGQQIWAEIGGNWPQMAKFGRRTHSTCPKQKQVHAGGSHHASSNLRGRQQIREYLSGLASQEPPPDIFACSGSSGLTPRLQIEVVRRGGVGMGCPTRRDAVPRKLPPYSRAGIPSTGKRQPAMRMLKTPSCTKSGRRSSDARLLFNAPAMPFPKSELWNSANALF